MAFAIHMQSISLRCKNNSTDLKETKNVRGAVGAMGECLHIKNSGPSIRSFMNWLWSIL